MTSISWIPILAAIPSDPAQRAGYITGMILGIVIMLGLVGFGFVSIVMAFVKRTTGWIVAGAVSGFFILVFGAIAIGGFVVGFARGFNDASRRTASHFNLSPPETITGKTVHFTLEKPAGWTAQRSQGAYDVIISNDQEFVGVIAEDIVVGSTDRAAEIVRNRFSSIGTDLSLGENQNVTFDGRAWVGFTAQCKVQNLPFAYQCYVYSGKEGSVQLMGWTFQKNWEQQSRDLDRVMRTVHLPLAGDSSKP